MFLFLFAFKDGTQNHLKEHLIDDLDYVLVPQEAWNKLVEWYGAVESQEAIARKVVEYGMFVKHCKVEVYLMELKLCVNGKQDTYVTHQFSKADTIGENLTQATFFLPITYPQSTLTLNSHPSPHTSLKNHVKN